MPSLLSRFIGPILNKQEIGIVKHHRGGLETDLMLAQIGLDLRRAPKH